ncbi:MAG TPA: hypothetical protein IAC14_06010 [Candidatus Scybalomonas excrementigallinarum]|nr:hypothetical protein [Candidatus Scybalomonas excrementigallinarum]
MKQFITTRTAYITIIFTMGILLQCLIAIGDCAIQQIPFMDISFSVEFLLQFLGAIVLVEVIDYFLVEDYIIGRIKNMKWSFCFVLVAAIYFPIMLFIAKLLNWFSFTIGSISKFTIIYVGITFFLYFYNKARWKREEKILNSYIEQIKREE